MLLTESIFFNKIASLSVSLFVCLFPKFSETVNPSKLEFWGMIPLGMQKVLYTHSLA